MQQLNFRNAGRLIALCFAVLVASNAAFLTIRLADYAVPRARLVSGLRMDYSRGVARTNNYSTDLMEGIDQYTDCVSLELALLGNTGPMRNALAPRLLSEEGVAPGGFVPPRDRCREVKDLVDGKATAEHGATYTRFWHGQASLLAVALNVLPLDGYRALLLVTALALIALCAVLAALHGPALLVGLSPLLAFSFALGGQLGYGQLLSYGPAQIAAWGMACFLVARQEHLTAVHLILLAVLAGCLEAFVDQMISVPLAAGIFLVVATAVSLPKLHSQSLPRAVASSTALAVAWAFGFVGTYIAKLALTTAVLGWHDVIDPFVEQLRFRTGSSDPGVGLPAQGGASWVGMIGRNVVRLSTELWHLGYTDRRQGMTSALIAVLGLLGWVWAIWRLARARRAGRVRPVLINGAGYLAASVFLLAWVAAFPEHTYRHSWFMVRSALLWLAGGWGWALTDFALSGRASTARAGATITRSRTVEAVAEPA